MKKMAAFKKYIDIGANLTDEMYQGLYHGSKKHDSDLNSVLKRSWNAGLERIIITGGSLEESKKSLELTRSDDRLYSTVGCHPTRCNEMEKNPEHYLEGLRGIIREGTDKIVAIGECGLDYDRTKFCEKDVQKRYFEHQLKLSKEFNLPLFLHCRAASEELLDILKRNMNDVVGGVVHSFDGTLEDAERFIDLGFFIGINGCSLRTEESLKVVASLPASRIMIETDAPWCEVKPTHPGFKFVKTKCETVKKEKYDPAKHLDVQVKNRNEPANIVHVLEILSAVRSEDENKLAEEIYNNTIKLFFK